MCVCVCLCGCIPHIPPQRPEDKVKNLLSYNQTDYANYSEDIDSPLYEDVNLTTKPPSP